MPAIVMFSAREQRRHLANSRLGMVVGVGQWAGFRAPLQFTCNTSAIAHLKLWGLLRGFNGHQEETMHLVQHTHSADGNTDTPRGERVCLLSWMTPELFSKHPRKGVLKIRNEKVHSSSRKT